MYYVSQTSTNDCGFACLKMVLATINNDEGFLYLTTKEKQKGYSYKDLIDIARTHHLNLIGFRVEEPDEIKNNKTFPLIVTINPQKDFNHAVLVTKISKSRIYISDPDKGCYSLSFKQFFKIWDKTGLAIEDFGNEESNIEIVKPLKKTDYLSLYVCQFMSGIGIVLATLFLSNEYKIAIPLFFLLISVVFEILLRFNLFSLMKKVDYAYLNLKVKSKYYFDYYRDYELYKKDMLTRPLNTIFMFILSTALIVVIVINSVWNFMIVLLPISLAIIEKIFIQPHFEKKNLELTRQELELSSSKDQQDYFLRVKELHKEGYKYGKVNLIKRYVFIILMVLVTFLTLKINNLMSLTNSLFFICSQFAIYQNVLPLLNYTDKKKHLQSQKVNLYKMVEQEKNN